MIKLADKIAKLVAFDVYGGIIAGIGVNAFTAILIEDSSSANSTIRLLAVSWGFIILGGLISASRMILGGIRENADPAGEEGEYSDRLASACKSKILGKEFNIGNIAVMTFFISLLISFLVIIFGSIYILAR
jgi:hypothetical protein